MFSREELKIILFVLILIFIILLYGQMDRNGYFKELWKEEDPIEKTFHEKAYEEILGEENEVSISETKRYYGKLFPIDTFLTEDNSKVSLKKGEYKIVGILSASCPSCISDIENAKRMTKEWGNTYYISLTKEDFDGLKKEGLSTYQIKDLEKDTFSAFFADGYFPSYFILDEENKVRFVMIGDMPFELKEKLYYSNFSKQNK